ncbi:MAG TPA: 30S ribosomal protein S12 methylthiotransferase RimO, partial [Planctomycetaceae bacterium]|nr:30S ribosomal protein S12 methylthiotransferase RimO [Planctomycetaceae bacterium]
MTQLPIVGEGAAACQIGSQSDLIAGLHVEPVEPANRRGTFSLISLGCPKNLVDSERMLGLLRDDGWQFVAEPKGSDLVIINTCAFIDSSRAESYGVIDEMVGLKQAGGIRGIIVAGCLAERQKETLLEERPGVDAVIGGFSRDE